MTTTTDTMKRPLAPVRLGPAPGRPPRREPFRPELLELAGIAATAKDLHTERDNQIIRALANGFPIAEVARAAGMSATAVRHIKLRTA